MIPTPKTARRVRWSAMLVGLPDALAALCEQLLAPLVVVRVPDVDGALERLPVDQPMVACALRDADVARGAQLRDRAGDVGTVLVVIPDACPPSDLEKLLKRALVEAEKQKG